MLGAVQPNLAPRLLCKERGGKGWDEEGGKCYKMFSVVGLSQWSARCAVVVGTVPEASFKEDLGGEGEDKEVSFASLGKRERLIWKAIGNSILIQRMM